MPLSKRLFLLVSLFLGSGGEAAWVQWREINVRHVYRDAKHECQAAKPGGSLIAALEMEADGRLKRIVLSNFPHNIVAYRTVYKAVELKGDQLRGVELFKDSTGSLWFKRLPLSDAYLAWILYYPTYFFSGCQLPQYPRSISPAQVVYEFETEDINDGIFISYSQKQNLKGTRSDGLAFEATLRLVQREYRPYEVP